MIAGGVIVLVVGLITRWIAGLVTGLVFTRLVTGLVTGLVAGLVTGFILTRLVTGLITGLVAGLVTRLSTLYFSPQTISLPITITRCMDYGLALDVLGRGIVCPY